MALGNSILVDGSWKQLGNAMINIGGSWKQIGKRYVIDNNQWKSIEVTIPVTNGLKNQLYAGAGVTKDGSNLVSYWSDQSGYGNDVSESNPTYQPLWISSSSINGRPAIRFSSSRLRYVQNSLIRNVGYVHIFYVVRFNGSGSIQILFASTTPTNTNRLHVRITASDYFYIGGRRLDGDTYDYNEFTSYSISTSTNYIYEVKSYYQDQQVSFIDNYIPSELSSSLYNSAGNTSDTDSDGIYLGSFSDYSYPLDADVAEILVYDRELTAYESNSIREYLKYRYV